MKKTIFSKYSNDRADKYKILTKIVNDEGDLRVEKHPLTKSATAHINKLGELYSKLDNMCKATDLQINKCSIENDIAQLEYIDGETLDRIMISMYESGDIDGLYRDFDRYVECVNSLATDEFEISKEFKAVFGNALIPIMTKSMSMTDVDMILSNIIVKDGEWYLIDYEWTFDFKIPARFVIYRGIAAFMNALGNYKSASNINLYDRVDMSVEEQGIYENMEKSFQSYVKEGYYALGDMYSEFGKNNISVWQAVDADNLKASLEQLSHDHEKARLYGEAKEAEVRDINDELIKAKEQIKVLTAENEQMTKNHKNTTEQLIAEKEELNNTLQEIYSSKKWKLVTKLAKLRTGGK